MPFTFSHPALIFPLKYLPDRLISFTGLVIGSMAPDFEYFMRMTVGSIYSHTFFGLFYFDLPVGIVLTFIFHDIVRDSFIDHLPGQLRRRFLELKTFNWDNAFKTTWAVVIFSILIGASSHILWDGFTHPLGYFVQRSAFLKQKIQLVGFRLPVYSILQNLSSLIGGTIVILFIRRMPKSQIKFQHKKDSYWFGVTMIVVTIMIVRFLSGLTLARYGNVIVSLISAFFIAIILIPLFFNRKHEGSKK
jgi:hypothetical protein